MLELRYKNYLRITLGSCVRFTFGNHVVKPCKWDQKLCSYYVWNLRQNFVTKNLVQFMLGSYVRVTFGNCVKKPCKWDQKFT